MPYLVLARKYRPQTFDQVVKQGHITQTLTHAISSDRVAHAILFSGPRGTGKTTVARILAKAMNCAEGPVPTPCNACGSCKEITIGNAVDVFEIDGASNNSVDQIRELRENIKYMPGYSRFKIYIIDEVHMLSVAAFNALLKTLEEPPSHIIFMFATTEVHKIPITILSRCQRHDFRLIDTESISKQMEMICRKEGAEISDESLWLIAREAGGSMRDALSLLDQVMICAEGPVTHSLVLETLGIIDRKVIFDISGAILDGDIPTVLDMLDETYDRGYEVQKLCADLIEHFRNLLVVKLGKNIRKLVNHPEHEIDLMRGQVKDISAAFVNQIFDLLFKEEHAVRHSAHPKLALEMAFIRMLQIKPALPIDVLIEKLDTLKDDVHDGRGGNRDKEKKPTVSEPVSPDENLDRTWETLLDTISDKHPALVANLRKCKLKKPAGQSLEIEVTDNGFNLNMIRRNKNMTALKKVCDDFFGKQMDLIITAKKNQNDKNLQKKNQTFGLKQEALSHPLVTTAMDIFDGKVVDVKLL